MLANRSWHRLRLAGAAVAAATGIAVQQQQRPAESSLFRRHSKAQTADARLVMSGDCGGTNTRLVLFKVSEEECLFCGKPPSGEIIFSKKYLNNEHTSFTDVCKLFLQDAGGLVPAACCLACAGAIDNNKVARAASLPRRHSTSQSARPTARSYSAIPPLLQFAR